MGERRDRVIRSGQGCHHRGAATKECGWRCTGNVWRGTCFPSQEKVKEKLPVSVKSGSAMLTGGVKAATFPFSVRRNPS